MPLSRLKELLDRQHVSYAIINHDTAYTAKEAAQRSHVSCSTVAKTVIVKVEGRLAMAVVPASCKVDLSALKKSLHAHSCTLATEQEFMTVFPDCEIGAVPPFGNLYGMMVYVAEELSKADEIAFCAGNHEQLIRIAWLDFEWLVEPRVKDFVLARSQHQIAQPVHLATTTL
jgi:Ala-tRNA(Pro) deacylase